MTHARAKSNDSAFALSWALAGMADAAKKRARRHTTASDGERMADEDGAMDEDLKREERAKDLDRLCDGAHRSGLRLGWWLVWGSSSVSAAYACGAMLAQGFGGRACSYPAAVLSRARMWCTRLPFPQNCA
ncbi:hypothetical protein C8R45DRAFT_1101796 [Mycena sanguinolenta]|nr:hypothetical protein C8R45DRAFT_1101796 [Mycena sanguinolenta]